MPGLDARALLKQARTFAGVSQGDLAERVGVARQTVNAFEAGRRSPTVNQLNALLAACGLGVRPQLLSLGAELSTRIDAALAAVPEIEHERLARLARSLDDLGVTWAVDGSTALALQGLAMGEGLACAVVIDDAFRRYLIKRPVQAPDRWNQLYPVSCEWSREEIQAAFDRGPALGWGLGFLRIRVVDGLPPVVPRISLADGTVVNVLAVTDVLEAQPDWAEVVLGALERRSRGQARASG